MEEKERYEIKDRWLVDTENNYKQIYAIDSYIDRPVIDLLNQQDKRIKELEYQLETKETINNLYKATISLRDGDFKDLVYENNKLKQENQQLKKQLAEKEQENERLKEEICKYEITLMDKNSQLKNQLHELPKKIIEEIRDNMSKRIMGKQIKWGDNIQIGFTYNAINEYLDTILTKYNGE